MKKETRKCSVCLFRNETNVKKCLNCDKNYNKFSPDKEKISKNPFNDQILKYIKGVYKTGNYTPTYSVMAEHFKCSKQTIHQYMKVLEIEDEVVFSPNRRAYFLKQS